MDNNNIENNVGAVDNMEITATENEYGADEIQVL